jgi:hypothetical protein
VIERHRRPAGNITKRSISTWILKRWA